MLGWGNVLQKHDRAMDGLKKAVKGATDWFGVWRAEKRKKSKTAKGDCSRAGWIRRVWCLFERAKAWFRMGLHKVTMQQEQERRRECPRCRGNPALER